MLFRSAKEKNAESRELRKELKLCKEILGEYEQISEKCKGLRNEVSLERQELIKGIQRQRIR